MWRRMCDWFNGPQNERSTAAHTPPFHESSGSPERGDWSFYTALGSVDHQETTTRPRRSAKPQGARRRLRFEECESGDFGQDSSRESLDVNGIDDDDIFTRREPVDSDELLQCYLRDALALGTSDDSYTPRRPHHSLNLEETRRRLQFEECDSGDVEQGSSRDSLDESAIDGDDIFPGQTVNSDERLVQYLIDASALGNLDTPRIPQHSLNREETRRRLQFEECESDDFEQEANYESLEVSGIDHDVIFTRPPPVDSDELLQQYLRDASALGTADDPYTPRRPRQLLNTEEARRRLQFEECDFDDFEQDGTRDSLDVSWIDHGGFSTRQGRVDADELSSHYLIDASALANTENPFTQRWQRNPEVSRRQLRFDESDLGDFEQDSFHESLNISGISAEGPVDLDARINNYLGDVSVESCDDRAAFPGEGPVDLDARIGNYLMDVSTDDNYEGMFFDHEPVDLDARIDHYLSDVSADDDYEGMFQGRGPVDLDARIGGYFGDVSVDNANEDSFLGQPIVGSDSFHDAAPADPNYPLDSSYGSDLSEHGFHGSFGRGSERSFVEADFIEEGFEFQVPLPSSSSSEEGEDFGDRLFMQAGYDDMRDFAEMFNHVPYEYEEPLPFLPSSPTQVYPVELQGMRGHPDDPFAIPRIHPSQIRYNFEEPVNLQDSGMSSIHECEISDRDLEGEEELKKHRVMSRIWPQYEAWWRQNRSKHSAWMEAMTLWPELAQYFPTHIQARSPPLELQPYLRSRWDPNVPGWLGSEEDAPNPNDYLLLLDESRDGDLSAYESESSYEDCE